MDCEAFRGEAACFLWNNRKRLQNGERPNGIRRITVPTQEDAETRQMSNLRQYFVRQRTKCINKIRGTFHHEGRKCDGTDNIEPCSDSRHRQRQGHEGLAQENQKTQRLENCEGSRHAETRDDHLAYFEATNDVSISRRPDCDGYAKNNITQEITIRFFEA